MAAQEDDSRTKNAASTNDEGGTATKPTSNTSEFVLGDAVDELQQHLGGYGRYQLVIYFLVSLVYMRGGWHVWIPIYQGWDPGHHCSASPGLSLNQSVPGSDQDGVWTWSQCEQYVNQSVSNKTEACRNGWTYLWEGSYTSIVSQYDIVCDKAYQNELSTTIYMVGTTCGVIFLSPLADRFGSKLVMLVCLWVQAVFGTCLIWAGNIVVFCVFKFFIGMCNMTIALTAYVLLTETFDAAHREIPTIAMQFFWAIGIMTMALFGYLIPKWEDLELTIALPINLLSILYIFILPDSLPWLLAKGRMKKAKDVIQRFVQFNKLPDVPNLDRKLEPFKLKKKDKTKKELHYNEAYVGNEEGVNGKHIDGIKVKDEKATDGTNSDAGSVSVEVYTVLTLFKTPRLRINSLIMFYLFLVNALAYFGIMYSTPQLDGDRFFNLFLLGVVELPAYLLCLGANRIIGRRRSISVFLFICAASNLAVPFIPDFSDDNTDLRKLKTALVIIGKFGITGSYSAIYLYASEIFPTVIRNQAVGASSFFENIGSIAAPNMVYVNNSMNNLPLAIFGGMTVVGCIVVLFLPETHNHPLPQTIDDVEHWNERHKVTESDVTATGTFKHIGD